MDKNQNRHKTTMLIIWLVIGMSIATVILAFLDKVTGDFVLALGAILGYAGNHTYNHMRTTPTKED